MIRYRSILLPAAMAGMLASCATSAAERPSPATLTPSAAAPAVPERVLPYPVEAPPWFERAVQAGTRTMTGRPGPRYWQNDASYTLEARIDTAAKRLDGRARIVYNNNSPDVLQNLHVDLTQNFHAPGVIRFEEAEVTGGVTLSRVVVDGTTLGTDGFGPRYAVRGTRLVILPPQPVQPNSSVTLEIDWSFTIPKAGAGERMGWDDGLFYLGYWYPQMAVYDDVIGWHPDPFVGSTEFYAGFASYDLTVDAPAGWVVMATGELTNAADVLAPAVLERYERAKGSDEVVHVLRAGDGAGATAAGTNGRLRWHFAADSIRDVAFSLTRDANWDAVRTPVGDRDGDGTTDYTLINSFWRSSAPKWSEVARYSAHAITFFSEFMDMPYPWPHMTAVEGGGIIGGGMEFPMMTLMGDYNQSSDSALYYVTAHELAHMWTPMIVSNDERRYTWMDEGTTTFNENSARNDFFPGRNHYLDDQNTYLQIAGTGFEGEIMRQSAFHYNTAAYGIASYMKPGSVLVALRAVLGEDTFMRAYREYFQRWKYKHPYPWDLWRTFEDVSGQDLDWFWRSWYHETWTLDQAVASVTTATGNTTIVIEDRGRVPMPVLLTITHGDGRTEQRTVPVDHWLAGNTSVTVTLDSGDVTRVEIDPERAFPDVDRSNNTWSR
jgi:hypothetical protein